MEKQIFRFLFLAAILLQFTCIDQKVEAKSHRRKHLRETTQNYEVQLLAVESLNEEIRQQNKHPIIHGKKVRREHKSAKSHEHGYKSMPRLWKHLQHLNNEDYAVLDDSVERNLARLSSEESSEEESLNKPRIEERLHCPKCEQKQQVAQVTQEELTKLRIEFVKQQILEKLRMKEPPNVSAVRLPIEPVNPEPDNKSKEVDDYYAHSSKKFIFLERVKHKCPQLDKHVSSICFSFKIDDRDIDGFDVNTAVLWLFKNSRKFRKLNSTLLENESIVVSELQQASDPDYLPISKTIAIQSFNAAGK